jgi:hypothetical protein
MRRWLNDARRLTQIVLLTKKILSARNIFFNVSLVRHPIRPSFYAHEIRVTEVGDARATLTPFRLTATLATCFQFHAHPPPDAQTPFRGAARG